MPGNFAERLAAKYNHVSSCAARRGGPKVVGATSPMRRACLLRTPSARPTTNPCLQGGWNALSTAPEAQSVDLRGFLPPRSSGEALPAGRKVPPAGLAALPAAPLESQGWGARERWTRGRAVRLPFGGTAAGCAPRLRRAPGPPPLRPAPPVVRALPAGGPTADGALCRWGALPSRRATDRQPPALITPRGSAAGGKGPQVQETVPTGGEGPPGPPAGAGGESPGRISCSRHPL